MMFSLLGLFAVLDTSAIAAEYSIVPNGDDRGPGTREQPLQSFSRAAELLKPGDTLYLLPGNYREPIHWKSFRGTARQPIRIVGRLRS